jgi:hypothetical protein
MGLGSTGTAYLWVVSCLIIPLKAKGAYQIFAFFAFGSPLF